MCQIHPIGKRLAQSTTMFSRYFQSGILCAYRTKQPMRHPQHSQVWFLLALAHGLALGLGGAACNIQPQPLPPGILDPDGTGGASPAPPFGDGGVHGDSGGGGGRSNDMPGGDAGNGDVTATDGGGARDAGTEGTLDGAADASSDAARDASDASADASGDASEDGGRDSEVTDGGSNGG